MSDLSDKVKKDFTEFSKRNKYIQELIKKFENGKATLSEVDAITGATGYALKVALEKNITENTAAFANAEELAEILHDTFGDNYDMINAVAADVQKRLDKIMSRQMRTSVPVQGLKSMLSGQATEIAVNGATSRSANMFTPMFRKTSGGGISGAPAK